MSIEPAHIIYSMWNNMFKRSLSHLEDPSELRVYELQLEICSGDL